MRVLLAEDDRDIRAVARLALRRAGFDVVAVASGEEAVAEARASRPDVVLLDWLMPGLDGIETMAALRNDERTAAIPVIIFTARTHADHVRQAFEAGAIGYLVKPFNALTLGDEVMRLLLERREAER